MESILLYRVCWCTWSHFSASYPLGTHRRTEHPLVCLLMSCKGKMWRHHRHVGTCSQLLKDFSIVSCVHHHEEHEGHVFLRSLYVILSFQLLTDNTMNTVVYLLRNKICVTLLTQWMLVVFDWSKRFLGYDDVQQDDCCSQISRTPPTNWNKSQCFEENTLYR